MANNEMLSPILGYQGHAKQREFHRSGERFCVLSAGVRSGKTLGATAEFLSRIMHDYASGKGKQPAGRGKRRQPRLLYWVIAPTLEMTQHVYRYVQALLPRDLIEKQSDGDYSLWLRPDILIEFKGADRPERLVGASVNGMLIDECARIKDEAWRGSLRGRLTDTKGWALMVTSPFGGKGCWVYQELISQAGKVPGIAAFHWTTADNDIIDPAEIEAARLQLPDRWFKRDYLASWDSFLGNVFDEFDEGLHIKTADQFMLEMGNPKSSGNGMRGLFRRVIAGVDWGWSSPGSIVVIGDLGNRYVVLDEVYADHRRIYAPHLGGGDSWVGDARRLRDLWGVSQFFCDPARPDAIFDFIQAGLPALGANNDILYGVRKMQEAMHPVNGKPRLTIMSNCKNFIREVKSYEWATSRTTDDFAEQPAPAQSDHALDAGRYAMVELTRYQTDETALRPSSFNQQPGRVRF